MGDIIGIGLQHFADRAASLKFERSRLSGLVAEAKERKERLLIELYTLLMCFAQFESCGIAEDAAIDLLAGTIDAFSNADSACNTILDEAGESWQSREPLDLTEARAMLDGLRRPHSKVLA